MSLWEHASYRDLTHPADEAAGRQLFEYFELAPESLLDVGCGDGYAERHIVPQHLRKRIKRFEGIDIDDAALGMYEGTANLTQGNMDDMPYEDNSFDVVLSSSAIENADDGGAMAEIARVLRPGGMFLGMRTTSRPHWELLTRFVDEYNGQGHDVTVIPTSRRASQDAYDNLAVIHRDAILRDEVISKFGYVAVVAIDKIGEYFEDLYTAAVVLPRLDELVHYVFDNKLDQEGYVQGGAYMPSIVNRHAGDMKEAGLQPGIHFVKGTVRVPNLFKQETGFTDVTAAHTTIDSLLVAARTEGAAFRPRIPLSYNQMVMLGAKPPVK